MSRDEDASVVQKALGWAYDHALKGFPGEPTAIELAEDYLREHADVEDAIRSLINWQTLKCGASGFVTGLGGVLTLPVSVPVDIALTYYVNVRMVAAIAHMRGYDLRADQTRTVVFLALAGDSAAEILSRVGANVATKMGENLLLKVNQAVGLKLAAKTGEKSALSLVKLAPVLGGFVGASVNAVACKAIGKGAAKLLKAS